MVHKLIISENSKPDTLDEIDKIFPKILSLFMIRVDNNVTKIIEIGWLYGGGHFITNSYFDNFFFYFNFQYPWFKSYSRIEHEKYELFAVWSCIPTHLAKLTKKCRGRVGKN